jgi:hypothetical protein
MTDKSELAALHREMVKDHLQEQGLKFLTDQDGNAFFILCLEERLLHFTAGSDDSGQVIWMECTSTETFTVDQASLLLFTINSWMKEHRWPRLTVRLRNGSKLYVSADSHLAIGDSLEECEIRRFFASNLSATMAFWREFSLPDVSAIDVEIREFLAEISSTSQPKEGD